MLIEADELSNVPAKIPHLEETIIREGVSEMGFRQLRQLLLDEDGTTAVEYCVMLGMILLVIIIAVASAGTGVASWWTDIDSEMQSNGI